MAAASIRRAPATVANLGLAVNRTYPATALISRLVTSGSLPVVVAGLSVPAAPAATLTAAAAKLVGSLTG
ncbi:hypothetical protein GCM10023322_06370 [Rugosimonospora acidiphila]|uniref:Uncharacterized protein n=1 Tax=Rugosimonospora acidiphila TaxID=556531 RepID=A0ABP9RIZ8_9ACTN